MGINFQERVIFTLTQILGYINDLQTDIFCLHCSLRDSSPFLPKVLAQVMSATCQRKGVTKPIAEPKATLVFVTGLVLLIMN